MSHELAKSALTSSPRVVFMGQVGDPELKALYMHAAALLAPSRMEGFGLPAVEAMRLGCPVIVSQNTAMHEIVGEAGFYCDSESPQTIAAAIRAAISDPSLRAERTEAGIRRSQLYDWTTSARSLLHVIKAEDV
jgi:glycosyltransferase involved in cell wall biosynthesis